MADRTFVAYERADKSPSRDGSEQRYDCHYAHDGVDSATLGPETPFGGSIERDLATVRERLRALGVELGLASDKADSRDTAVDPDPVATGLSWNEVVEAVDYRIYDCCLRVAADWTATSFLALWFGLGDRGGAERDAVGDGALLAADAQDEEYARGWFEGAKSATADGLRCDRYDESTARGYLAGRVREFAGDRECYVASGADS